MVSLSTCWRIAQAACLMLWIGSPSAIAAEAGHGTLRIGINDYPASFNPNTESQGVKAYVQWIAHRPVTAYDVDWKLICSLCTELPSRAAKTMWSETLPSGESVVALQYTIRPDAKWGDGTAITTKDVLFTLEVGRNPASGWVSLDMFEREIESIEAVDRRTFIIRRRTQACEAEQINSFQLLPAHLEEPVYRSDPSRYRVKSLYETDTTNPGLWNGPFRPTKIIPGRQITMVRNEHWDGKKPNFDEIIVHAFEDNQDLETALLKGTVDYVSGEYGFTSHVASQIQRHHGFRFDIRWGHGSSFRHISLNHDNPLFKDVRVRQAMLMALDRPGINNRLFYGRNIIAKTDTNPRDSVYHADVRDYHYDLAGARRMLDEAGWKPGPDGIRVNAAKQRFAFDLWAASGDRSIDRELQILQEMWREAGIAVTTKRPSPRVLFGEILPERRFNGAAIFSWVAAPRESSRSILHTSQIPTKENGFSGQNFIAYRNPVMDQLQDQLTSSCVAPMNEQAWIASQKLFAEDLPNLPLYYMASVFILPKWLKGLQPTGHLFDTTLRIEHWYRSAESADVGLVERPVPAR